MPRSTAKRKDYLQIDNAARLSEHEWLPYPYSQQSTTHHRHHISERVCIQLLLTRPYSQLKLVLVRHGLGVRSLMSEPPIFFLAFALHLWFLADERKAGNQLAKSGWVNRMTSLDDLVKEAGVELWRGMIPNTQWNVR